MLNELLAKGHETFYQRKEDGSGNRPEGSDVDEQILLDLEREAFLSLVGQPKTQDRIRHMLSNHN